MDEEKTIETVRSLYRLLVTFESLKSCDMLLPGRQSIYEHTLEDAYAALVALEQELDQLGNEIEYHHLRIAAATEEVQGLF